MGELLLDDWTIAGSQWSALPLRVGRLDWLTVFEAQVGARDGGVSLEEVGRDVRHGAARGGSYVVRSVNRLAVATEESSESSAGGLDIRTMECEHRLGLGLVHVPRTVCLLVMEAANAKGEKMFAQRFGINWWN